VNGETAIRLDEFRAWLRGYLEAAGVSPERREVILRELARVAEPFVIQKTPVIPLMPYTPAPVVPDPWWLPGMQPQIWCGTTNVCAAGTLP
jgi:hypothetical protein